MMRRTRLIYEAPDKGLHTVPEIAAIAAAELGWDEARTQSEIEAYTARAEAEIAAAAEPDDESAARVRDHLGEVAPLQAMGSGNDV